MVIIPGMEETIMYIHARTKEEPCHIDHCDRMTDEVCDNCGQATCEQHLHERPHEQQYWCSDCVANGGAIIL